MSAVVDCPACHESLELPDEFLDGVVCPHCEAAFLLKLVLLNDDGEEMPSGPTGLSVTDASAAAAGSAGHATMSGSGDVSGPGSLQVTTDGTSKNDSDSKKPSSSEPNKASADADDESPWAGMGGVVASTNAEPGDKDSMSAKAARQRKKKGPGLLVQAIGVFGGGAVGLYLGYWLLNFFGGPQFYFVKLPLPFVSHASSQEPETEDFAPPRNGPITIESPRGKPKPKPKNRTSLPLDNSQTQAPVPMPLVPGATAKVALQPATESGVPRYASQDLADALTIADRFTAASIQNTVSREMYQAVSHLAQVVTFVDVNQANALNRRQAVDTVLRRLTDQHEKLAAINAYAVEQLNAHAAEQLQAAAPGSVAASQGIVLAGQVLESHSAGPWHLLRVRLLAVEPRPAVTLVSSGRIPLAIGASRLFVGSLIPYPQQSLEGYTLDEAPVVWAGMWVTISAELSS